MPTQRGGAVQNERVTPARPNIVLVMIDDMGFGASSAYGGPCAMPTADRLAAEGLRYTRFHVTALCSPTRQALLTGRNHHSVGMGGTTEMATAEPGYTSIRPPSAATMAQILRAAGYSTGAFGKWHQTPATEVSASGPFDRWPTGEGFEEFYGDSTTEPSTPATCEPSPVPVASSASTCPSHRRTRTRQPSSRHFLRS